MDVAMNTGLISECSGEVVKILDHTNDRARPRAIYSHGLSKNFFRRKIELLARVSFTTNSLTVSDGSNIPSSNERNIKSGEIIFICTTESDTKFFLLGAIIKHERCSPMLIEKMETRKQAGYTFHMRQLRHPIVAKSSSSHHSNLQESSRRPPD